MKRYSFILSLTLLNVIIILGSCTMKKDVSGILLNSFDERKQISSATFTNIETEWIAGKVQSATSKVYVQRIPNNTEFPFKFRMEYEDGTIITFDGQNYSWSDPKTKSGVIYENLTTKNREIEQALNIIGRILPSEDKDKVKKFFDDKENVKYLGTIELLGAKCDILSYSFKKHEGVIEYEMNIYKDSEKGFTRKIEEVVYLNKVRFAVERMLNQDIQTNVKLNNSLFTQNIPSDYKVNRINPNQQKEEDKTANQEEESNLIKEGSDAPAWTLMDGNGKQVSLSDLHGKLVLLDFWGTWCPWCVAAMPKIQKIYDTYKNKGLVVYGISCKEKEGANPVAFMKQNGFNYGVLLKGIDIAKLYNVKGFPTLYIIGKDGKVIGTEEGFDTDMEQKLTDIIKKNL